MESAQEIQIESQSQKPKSSIFVCKTCKSSEVKVDRPKKVVNPDEPIVVKLSATKDTHNDQKYIVKIGSKTVGFGQKGASDFTIHKNEERRQLYIARHSKREERYWDLKDKSNLLTASFWARYLLWQFPTIEEAIKYIQEEANIKIKYTKNSIDRQQRKLAKLVKKNILDDQDE